MPRYSPLLSYPLSLWGKVKGERKGIIYIEGEFIKDFFSSVSSNNQGVHNNPLKGKVNKEFIRKDYFQPDLMFFMTCEMM